MRALRTTSRGLTFIEVSFAAIVAMLLGAAIAGVGHTILSADRASAENGRAAELGLGLLEEAASMPFDDPTLGETTLGPEIGEWTGLHRTGFDDVDDYTVWDNRPIETQAGTAVAIPYLLSVDVAWVDPNDFRLVSGTATRAKRIRVIVLTTAGDTLSVVETARVNGGRLVDLNY